MVGVFVGGRSILEEPAFRFVAIWITFLGLITALAVWRGLARTQRFLNQAYASFQIKRLCLQNPSSLARIFLWNPLC
jgi:hypothetical protein